MVKPEQIVWSPKYFWFFEKYYGQADFNILWVIFNMNLPQVSFIII